MRKLTYFVAATLDGYIAGPDRGDPSGQGLFSVTPDLIEFIATRFPETLPAPARAAMGIDGPGQVFDTVLEGQTSYELGLAAGLDDAYPHLRHLVFSTTMSSVPSNDIEVVSDNALDRVRSLKAEDGLGIWLVGGGALAHSLLPEIDQLVIKQNPIAIGDGTPMFSGPHQPTRFTPLHDQLLDAGVRVLTLDRA